MTRAIKRFAADQEDAMQLTNFTDYGLRAPMRLAATPLIDAVSPAKMSLHWTTQPPQMDADEDGKDYSRWR